MEIQRPAMFRLLQLSPIEVKEEFDERCERCYGFVQNLIFGLSESEAHDALNNTVCKSPQAHEEVCLGILICILTEPENAPRYYRDLTYVSRDGLALVIRDLNVIILDRYLKLHENSRIQLIWLLREILKNSINGADSTIYNLLRQIAGGDISAKNIWLAENVLDLLVENRLWLERHSILIATVVYTFLRLIVDHGNPMYNKLRQKEIDFCISLLREKFSECLVIGRDLVRLLQNVSRIPEFEVLWKDIHNNPTLLAPNFNGILQLMQTRTSRRFLQCRLTPDMERKIMYLTSHVKFGQQKRFQEWFQRQYLSTPESQSLRCDLIRFICGVIHPTNEVLCSDIIPRWAVIGWILSSCTSNVAASNAKLSLFYDWLFFDAERDNIMNIEPAILVMFYSLRTHPVITVTLLDFLCRIMKNFFVPLSTHIKKGICSALQLIVEKRVMASLSILFESQKIDIELRCLIKECFPEFCTLSAEQNLSNFNQAIIENNGYLNNGMMCKEVNDVTCNSMLSNAIHSNKATIVLDDRFNEEAMATGEDSLKKPKLKPNLNNKIKYIKTSYNNQTVDFNNVVNLLSSDLKNILISLKNEKENESKCELMVKFLQILLQKDDLDQNKIAAIAKCLTVILKDDLTRIVFPKVCNLDIETLEESVGYPLFVIFRDLVQTPEDDPSQEPIFNLLNELTIHTKSIGYLLIYFLKVSKNIDSKMSAYREYAKALNKDLEQCLLEDLEMCQFEEMKMFCYIIVDVFTVFSNIAVNNADFINLLVSCVDASQLQDLICQILRGNFIMLKNESFLPLLNASLEWETFEQFCLWQLIDAHNISLDYILPVLPKLEYDVHSEALMHIILLLKKEEPSSDFLKHILSRNASKCDYFTISILAYWAQKHTEKLGELISSQMLKSTPGKKRRQGTLKYQLTSTVEQVLIHLDFLRQKTNVTNFFYNETIQNALNSIQISCNDIQKARFSELFALAEEAEQLNSKPNLKRNAKTNKTRGKSRQVEESNSDTEASESINLKSKKKRVQKDSSSESDYSQDELNSSPAKTKTARKKRQKTLITSDSE